jgi:hypothetical protein
MTADLTAKLRAAISAALPCTIAGQREPCDPKASYGCWRCRDATAVLAAVAPIVAEARREALEEAAAIADASEHRHDDCGSSIAAAIRTLKGEPKPK